LGLGEFAFNDFQSSSAIAFVLGFFAGYSDVQPTRLISNVLDCAAERRAPG
jgi:hypothetical protein